MLPEITLPLNKPVTVFTIVSLVFLILPIILKKVKIPGLVGLILAGVALGPNGFHILELDSSVQLFGTVGILYIMFLSGLEIDPYDFKKSRLKSLVFGLITFLIPQVGGTLLSVYVMKISWPSSILLASMFASHTLIAYPVASRLGLTKRESVVIAVGGTIVTNVLALLVLAIIINNNKPDTSFVFWVIFGTSFLLFCAFTLWILPLIGRFFFRRTDGDGISHYIFILAAMLFSSFLAQAVGIESIIGAFLAGFALNSLVPEGSPLMNRVQFVGNAIFIPYFLIYVGMMVNFKDFFSGSFIKENWIMAIFMTLVATAGKWLPAYITQKIYKYSAKDRNLIFGLSNAQAASTLAAVLIGYQLELLTASVLNGTIIMILVTCLVSSFVVEQTGIALAKEEEPISVDDSDSQLDINKEVILVPIANPDSIESMMDLAFYMKSQEAPRPVYPLVVVHDEEDAVKKLAVKEKMLHQAKNYASASGNLVRVISRIDESVISGILRVSKELDTTDILMGWNKKTRFFDKVIFGSVVDRLLDNNSDSIYLTRLIRPLGLMKRILVVVLEHAEYEFGFSSWVRKIKNLSRKIKASVHFFGKEPTLLKIQEELDKKKDTEISATFREFRFWSKFREFAKESTENDLVVVVSARKKSVSYIPFVEQIPEVLSKNFNHCGFIIVYPAQDKEGDFYNLSPMGELVGGLGLTPFNKVKEKAGKMWQRFWDKKEKN